MQVAYFLGWVDNEIFLPMVLRCARSAIVEQSASIFGNKLSLEAFKAALKTNHDILDRITFKRMQGTNKDILNYLYKSTDCDLT